MGEFSVEGVVEKSVDATTCNLSDSAPIEPISTYRKARCESILRKAEFEPYTGIRIRLSVTNDKRKSTESPQRSFAPNHRRS